jgi:hypothetical protein
VPTFNPNNLYATFDAWTSDSKGASLPAFPTHPPGATVPAGIQTLEAGYQQSEVNAATTRIARQSATPRPTAIPVTLEWNLIDRSDEQGYYHFVLFEVGKTVTVEQGGYIGRYVPPGAARWYCPPQPGRFGPPHTTDSCIQFFSQSPDLGTFEGAS